MKKAVFLILTFILCLSLSACGKSQAVKNVETLIDAIGEVTLDSGNTIATAQSAYDVLSEEEKSEVKNYAILSSAKVAYTVALIDAIGEVTLDSSNTITTAQSAYDMLSEEEKSEVKNYAILSSAKVAYTVALIDAIGEVTLDSESAIVAAETAYSTLSVVEKVDIKPIWLKLLAARNRFDFLVKVHSLSLLGTWKEIDMKPYRSGYSITFFEDGTCCHTVSNGEFIEEYELTENGVDLLGPAEFVFEEVAGFTVLADISGHLAYVREEDLEALRDKVFVVVDLSSADISEYADFVHLDYTLNDFGEKENRDTYLIVSTVYEQGLTYIHSSDDTSVEYGRGYTISRFPFGHTCDVPEFGRMSGEIFFIRSEYVDEIEFTDSVRNISSTKLGVDSYITTSYTQYLDYPY